MHADSESEPDALEHRDGDLDRLGEPVIDGDTVPLEDLRALEDAAVLRDADADREKMVALADALPDSATVALMDSSADGDIDDEYDGDAENELDPDAEPDVREDGLAREDVLGARVVVLIAVPLGVLL